jgi:hypothetical protein
MPAQTPEDKDKLYDDMYGNPYTENKEETASEEIEEEKSEEKTDTTETTEETKTDTDTEKSDTEETEVTDTKVETEEIEKKKKGDLKVALRETRGKFRDYRQNSKDEIKRLESELDSYKRQKVTEDYEGMTDDEKKQRQIEKDVAEVKQRLREADIRESERLIQDDVNRADAELTKEGYEPGLLKWAIPQIKDELNLLPEDERKAKDNPEGWKEIVKETIVPFIKTVASISEKKEKFAKKEEDKKKAQMLGEKRGIQKEPEKKYDYFEDRWAKQKSP